MEESLLRKDDKALPTQDIAVIQGRKAPEEK